MSELALLGGAPVRTEPYPSWPIYHPDDLKAVEEVLKSGRWGGNYAEAPGFIADEVAQEFAAFHDAKYGIPCMNGTIALDGQVLPGVDLRLRALSKQLTIHMLSADTRGRAVQTAQALGANLAVVASGREREQKQRFVQDLGSHSVVAIGNGANDQQMLQAAVLGIAVLGNEGLSVAALTSADVLVGSIEDALDLLLKPPPLRATLRH